MKLLNQIFKFSFFIILNCFLSSVSFADIPYEIQFNAVFNFDELPVSGNHTAIVRVFSDNQIVYRESVPGVLFSQGVGKITIGGEDTLLVNSIFDDPDLEISISVLQHNLRFPLSSVPYTIRSAESNMARRIDNEDVMIFLEAEERVGINTLTPEVSLDVDGVVKVFDILNTSEPSNGTFYWDGNLNQFRAYIDDEWYSMSWIPEPEDRSKWALSTDPLTIETLKNVGIGIAPNTFALAVTEDVYIRDEVEIVGNINVFGSALLHSGYGFNDDGHLNVPKIVLSASNIWDGGNLIFSGVLTGDGSNLTNLNHFDDDSFSTEHFQDDSVLNEHIFDLSIQTQHLNDRIITLNLLALNQITGNLIEDYSLTAHHIATGAIQTHHMVQNQFASADISLNQFVKEKFKDDTILSRHIVDGNITGVKIITQNVLSAHFINSAINTNLIQDGTLTASHVPLLSIPISNYNDVFSISRGGTGQTLFDNYGVLFTNSSGELSASADFLMIQDGLMGVGGAPDSNSLITVQDNGPLRLSVYADDEDPGLLQLQNTSASWNVYTDILGDLIIDSFSDQVMKFTLQGNIGIGYNDPDEVLSLGGPILIGSALGSGLPGSIQYDNGQFSLYTSSWQTISSAAISYRTNQNMDRSGLISSSVIFADNSNLTGQNILIRSAKNSNVSGVGLDVNEVSYSTLNGSFSSIFFNQFSRVDTHFSSAKHSMTSTINIENATVSFSDQSELDLIDSRSSFISNSQLNLLESSGAFLSSTLAHSSFSKLNQLTNSTVKSSLSAIQYADFIDVETNFSDLSFSSKLTGIVNESSLQFSENSRLSINNGYLSHVNDSDISGVNHFILGGYGHKVEANDYLAFSGNQHHVTGERSIGIGDSLDIRHDDVVLINASSTPLRSDRNGQLKIQADGGVDIMVSPEHSLASVSDFDGWGHISDESIKVGKMSINPVSILSKFRQLPVQYWVYRNQEDVQHLGPMAQDFYRIFNYGNSDKVIHGIDSDGVLLATIKGVYLNLVQFNDSLDINLSSNNSDQQKIELISKELGDISKKINALESNYFKNKRFLNQLNEDNKVQNSMINYIQSNVTQIKNQIILKNLLPFRGVFFISGIVFGAFVCAFLIWRRQND